MVRVRIKLSLFLIKATKVLHSREVCEFEFVFCCLINIKPTVGSRNQAPCHFKGIIGCDMHFYMFWTVMCVLAVCVHNHPIMIQIHQVLFLSTKLFTPFSNQAILSFSSVWRHTDEGPPTIIWLTGAFQHRLHWCLTLDPPWVSRHQSALVSPPEQM